MAKNKSTVYLGYEDEEVINKFVACLDSTINKIGGNPDWPNGNIKIPPCPLCGAIRPLIVQIYAPLEFSQFHRTLFIFACLSPLCSENSNSWLCVRTQYLDVSGYNIGNTHTYNTVIGTDDNGKDEIKNKNMHKSKIKKITWCKGTDDWGVNINSLGIIEKMDTGGDNDESDESVEENGNVVQDKNVKMLSDLNDDLKKHSVGLDMNDEDDEDDSNSMESEIIKDFHQIQINSSQQTDEDPNANCAAAATNIFNEGDCNYAYSSNDAVAVLCAEIEDSETDVVQIETPQKPDRDLIAMLKHRNSSACLRSLTKLSDITLKSFFIAVDVDNQSQTKEYEYYTDGALSAEHIRDLYQDYKKQDEVNNHSPTNRSNNRQLGVGNLEDQERYEKMLPPHGDLMFHHFVSVLQKNPGHILRYSRDTLPLLIAPLKESIPKCRNCNGETICEVQLLPTLIPKLKIKQTGETAPIEYGNVLIFTCLKSCWDTPDKWRYEHVFVQAENYSLSDHWI